jgi:hypothetical protein
VTGGVHALGRLRSPWTDGQSIAGSNIDRFRLLASKTVGEAWDRFGSHALAIQGEANLVSGRSDHELIAGSSTARRRATSFALTREGAPGSSPRSSTPCSSRLTPWIVGAYIPPLVYRREPSPLRRLGGQRVV